MGIVHINAGLKLVMRLLKVRADDVSTETCIYAGNVSFLGHTKMLHLKLCVFLRLWLTENNNNKNTTNIVWPSFCGQQFYFDVALIVSRKIRSWKMNKVKKNPFQIKLQTTTKTLKSQLFQCLFHCIRTQCWFCLRLFIWHTYTQRER